jgi:hypothetical protein
MRLVSFLLFLFFAMPSVYAQYGACRDTTIIQSNSACSSHGFFPVCGYCNGKSVTYRNDCFANTDGVNYLPGPCEEFSIDFYPNAINDKDAEFFKPTILSKNKIGSTIYIMDVYGVIYKNIPIFSSSYTANVASTPAFQDVISLSDLKNGMYLFVFSGPSQMIVKKFIRMN